MDTFARKFTLSRQALINDDLGAFSDSAKLMGRAAAQMEAKLAAPLAANSGNDDDRLSYFYSDEFRARMRNLNDAMRLGMQLPTSKLIESHIGCPAALFFEYLASVSDEDGVAEVPLGAGEYITIELPRPQK